jgi:hypothetical protein
MKFSPDFFFNLCEDVYVVNSRNFVASMSVTKENPIVIFTKITYLLGEQCGIPSRESHQPTVTS